MSFHPTNVPEYSCADFEKSFDAYVDDTLEAQTAEMCCRHLAKCPACDREVTRWQQTRILLSTAVADFATAVDVSSVHSDVMAALGFGADAPRRRGDLREAAHERGADARRSGGRRERRAAVPGRRRAFAAVWHFTSAATVSASLAAAAVLLLMPAPVSSPVAGTEQNTTTPARRLASSVFNPRSWMTLGDDPVTPASYAPPPRQRPEVSPVEGIESAPGRLVSTWVQPRTNARVIWVQDSGDGAPLRTAGLER